MDEMSADCYAEKICHAHFQPQHGGYKKLDIFPKNPFFCRGSVAEIQNHNSGTRVQAPLRPKYHAQEWN